MAWTDERIALLKQYWESGSSASQIADRLGEGLSRNAVIGKAHRLGLSARPSPLKTAEPRNGEAKPAARKVEAKPATKPVAAAKPPANVAPATAAKPAAPVALATPALATPALAPVALAPVAQTAPPSDVPPAPVPVPARASQPVRAKGAKVTLLDLNDRICKWPIGHPDEAGFHFCGKPVNPGFPYCQEHCLVAYQAQMPRRDRPGGPSRPFGPNLPRPR